MNLAVNDKVRNLEQVRIQRACCPHLGLGPGVLKGAYVQAPRYVADALALIGRRCIDIDALIGETLPLTRLSDAIDGMVNRRAFKYALIPGQ